VLLQQLLAGMPHQHVRHVDGAGDQQQAQPVRAGQQPQAEPHHGVAEIVRVPRVAPQAGVEHPPRIGRVGPEPAQLRVARRLEAEPDRPYRDSQPGQAPERPMLVHGRLHRQRHEPHDPALHPVDVAQHEDGQVPAVAPQQRGVPLVLALAAVAGEDVRAEPQPPHRGEHQHQHPASRGAGASRQEEGDQGDQHEPQRPDRVHDRVHLGEHRVPERRQHEHGYHGGRDRQVDEQRSPAHALSPTTGSPAIRSLNASTATRYSCGFPEPLAASKACS